MKELSTKQLRSLVYQYTKRDNKKALIPLALDMFIYVAAITGVILFESMALKVLCSLIAGGVISSIFVIAHDAAHDALTNNKTLNKVIGRITLLPSLHNYSLWLIAHNRKHHQFTNVKGMNSWSPLSKEEYDALPKWKQVLERSYRTVPGLCLYYLVERWWKDKFIPFKRTVGKHQAKYWWDFLLLSAYLVAFLGILVVSGTSISYNTPFQMITLGFVVPFLVWNLMMGFTIYQHHTHETIMWTTSRDKRDQLGHQEDFTMHISYPAWYNHLSHNIMEHTAHHVDPRIPFYHLMDAQKVLFDELGEDMNFQKFSFSQFLHTLRTCKLYDYEQHQWMSFSGETTHKIEVEDEKQPTAVVIELAA